MRITVLNVLQDNYSYVVHSERNNEVAVVDPVDPKQLVQFLEKNDLRLTKILTTHHHWDHAGGNEELAKRYSPAIYAGCARSTAATHIVRDGEEIDFNEIKIVCMSTPCHTTSHVCYYLKNDKKSCVFTGDTLFVGGCGKFFEGTAQQMYDNFKRFSKLPDDTEVYCGHDYTLKNMQFAASLNLKRKNFFAERVEFYRKLKSEGQNSVPSTILMEKLQNVFMQCDELQELGLTSPVECMDALRSMKNKF